MEKRIQAKTDEPPALGARLAPGVALIFFALIAYFPAIEAGFIWDDDAYVIANPTLRTVDGLERIWLEPTASPQYYPLVFSSFWAEFHLWDLHPRGYHLVNVLLHAANGILLWRVLRQLQVPAAWFISALFVLHPVHVESVAWITERKNVLSGFFYLAAALAYFRFSPPDQVALSFTGRWGWYLLAVFLFACALLSKTVTCSLPAALLLVYWWKRPRLNWREIAALVPFFALGVALAMVTVWMEKHHVGAGKDWHLTPVERVLVAGRALWFYAGKLTWPTGLSFIYPRWEINAHAAWQYLFPAAAMAVLVGFWLARRRLGKGPLVACLFFAGTLFPALGFIDVYPMRFSFVADHFQYLASIGLLALFTSAALMLLRRLAPDQPIVVPAMGATCLVIFTVLTWAQAEVYTDLKTLWNDTLQENPDCWLAHNNLGQILFVQKRFEEARRHHAEAVRLKPDDPYHHFNLGKDLWFQDRVGEAAEAFAESVRLDPEFEDSQFYLGLALLQLRKPDEAIVHFREAVRIKPDFTDAHNSLGVALAQQGKQAEAIPHFEAVARANPENPMAWHNLALAHGELKQFPQAINCARRAVLLRPDDPRLQQTLETLLKEQAKARGGERK